MNESNRGLWLLVILVCGAAGAAAYYTWNKVEQVASPPAPQSETSAAPSAAATSETARYPIVEDEDEEDEHSVAKGAASQPAPSPLPALDDSDPVVTAELAKLLGKVNPEALINLDQLVRRAVVTANSVKERRQISQEFALFKPIPGTLEVIQGKDGQTIDPKGYQRYSACISLVQAVDAKKLAAFYIRFYPLFQAAYKDLGLRGYFNDRMVEGIDQLLGAPEPEAPVRVYSTSVFYKFSDPNLEALPSSQKIMVRIGPEAETLVKAKLRQFRARIIHHTTG